MIRRTTSQPTRLREYLAVASLSELTDAEEQQIDSVDSFVHHRFFVRLAPPTKPNHRSPAVSSANTSMMCENNTTLTFTTATGKLPMCVEWAQVSMYRMAVGIIYAGILLYFAI